MPGKTEALRNFFKVVKKEKWNEFGKSQKRSGTDKERDFLLSTPMGDMVIVYLESKDMNKTFGEFAASKDPFDVWFKGELKNLTGVDLNQPSGPLPELMLTYDK